jgi:phosphoserine phosphatase RsbU/P
MTEQNKDPFLTTMRIEIPPDLALAGDERKKAEAKARAPAPQKIIHLPAPHKERGPFGEPDFQALLQNIYDAVLITDPRGQIVNANARAVQFFGFATSEFTGLNVVQLISGATADLFSTIWQTLQGDRFVLIEAWCNRKESDVFPAEISVNRLRLSNIDYLSFFVRNITLRKEAEEQLRTSDTAMRNSGGGIAITGTDGNLLYCNPAMLKVWGLNENEVQGANLRHFLSDPQVADEMNKMVREGATWGREVVMKRTDGGFFSAQVSVAPNVNTDGELTGMVISLQDISTLKRAQADLEDHAQKLRLRNAEMEDDLRMAREVQLVFLPQEYPRFPRAGPPDKTTLSFSHLYHPSGVVGGDFFDILSISDAQAGVLIADVAGHGMRAALVVATLRGLIEQLSPAASDPAAFLTGLNNTYLSIFRPTGDAMFTTALYLTVDTASGRVLCSSAGHVPPFKLSRGPGTVEQVGFPREAQGPGLGLYPMSSYRNIEFPVQAGDVLLLYTDGLSEVRNPEGQYYDAARMPACLAENIRRRSSDLLKAVMADARQFAKSERFEDDVCLLAVEVCRLGR